MLMWSDYIRYRGVIWQIPTCGPGFRSIFFCSFLLSMLHDLGHASRRQTCKLTSRAIKKSASYQGRYRYPIIIGAWGHLVLFFYRFWNFCIVYEIEWRSTNSAEKLSVLWVTPTGGCADVFPWGAAGSRRREAAPQRKISSITPRAEWVGETLKISPEVCAFNYIRKLYKKYPKR